MRKQVKRTNARALQLEREADGGRVLTRALSPVGDPSFDLEAPSAERGELGHPEVCSKGANWIESGDGMGEHGAERMRED